MDVPNIGGLLGVRVEGGLQGGTPEDCRVDCWENNTVMFEI
jgi:hypothetical protein